MLLKKHGTFITEHKLWNTKTVYRQGHVMMRYRQVPRALRFKSRMVSDLNQDLCGGWFTENSDDLVVHQVLSGKKPFGSIVNTDRNNLLRKKAAAKRQACYSRFWKRNDDQYELLICQKRSLSENFDLDGLCRDYSEHVPFCKDHIRSQIEQFSSYRLCDFFGGWDVENVPGWLTGLILGYPVENTISLYRTFNLLW